MFYLTIKLAKIQLVEYIMFKKDWNTIISICVKPSTCSGSQNLEINCPCQNNWTPYTVQEKMTCMYCPNAYTNVIPNEELKMYVFNFY